VIIGDLSSAIGLDEVTHVAGSVLALDAILSFKEDFPDQFLRGCGIREEEIEYFRSLVSQPIRFYTCFISYCTADEEFVSRLHNDFQVAGIRCWKWDHDARTGRTIWGEIDYAIRVHDRLVLIASESSMKSPYVEREVERALQQEDERKRLVQRGEFKGDTNVLFPVRLDDFVLEGWQHERKADVVSRVIADARGWDSDPQVYAKVRDRLIEDLKAE
jgi:hypothetical protein